MSKYVENYDSIKICKAKSEYNSQTLINKSITETGNVHSHSEKKNYYNFIDRRNMDSYGM